MPTTSGSCRCRNSSTRSRTAANAASDRHLCTATRNGTARNAKGQRGKWKWRRTEAESQPPGRPRGKGKRRNGEVQTRTLGGNTLATRNRRRVASRLSYRASRVLDCPRVQQPGRTSRGGACQFQAFRDYLSGRSRLTSDAMCCSSNCCASGSTDRCRGAFTPRTRSNSRLPVMALSAAAQYSAMARDQYPAGNGGRCKSS